MVCPQCGSQIRDGSAFCPNCGSRLAAPSQYVQPVQYQQQQYSQQGYEQQYGQYQQPYGQYGQQYQDNMPKYGEPSHGKVDFIDAVKLYFINYINFTGRASRSEFWWVVLFSFLLSIVTSVIDLLLGVQVISGIVNLGCLIPSLSLTVRRLHDTRRRWTWILMGLIPLAGPIILIVYACQASDNYNRWGPRPPMC